MTVLQVLAADLESGDTVKAALHVEVLQKGQPGTRKYSSSLDYIRNIQIYKIKIGLHKMCNKLEVSTVCAKLATTYTTSQKFSEGSCDL